MFKPDTFCYVCWEFKSQRKNFTHLTKKCNELYFGYNVGDQDKSWAPPICCVGWVNGSRHKPSAVPMVWREPTSDC